MRSLFLLTIYGFFPTLRLRESPDVGGSLLIIVGGACIFTLLGWLICLFRVAGSGIPGVGVAPFGNGLPSDFASGIPGVGVPPVGSLLAFAGSGIPGVVFDEGGMGDVESPSGKFFESILTFPLGFEFELVVAAGPQAMPAAIKAHKITNKILFTIYLINQSLCILK